jgi:hypothetical protein
VRDVILHFRRFFKSIYCYLIDTAIYLAKEENSLVNIACEFKVVYVFSFPPITPTLLLSFPFLLPPLCFSCITPDRGEARGEGLLLKIFLYISLSLSGVFGGSKWLAFVPVTRPIMPAWREIKLLPSSVLSPLSSFLYPLKRGGEGRLRGEGGAAVSPKMKAKLPEVNHLETSLYRYYLFLFCPGTQHFSGSPKIISVLPASNQKEGKIVYTTLIGETDKNNESLPSKGEYSKMPITVGLPKSYKTQGNRVLIVPDSIFIFRSLYVKVNTFIKGSNTVNNLSKFRLYSTGSATQTRNVLEKLDSLSERVKKNSKNPIDRNLINILSDPFLLEIAFKNINPRVLTSQLKRRKFKHTVKPWAGQRLNPNKIRPNFNPSLTAVPNNSNLSFEHKLVLLDLRTRSDDALALPPLEFNFN